MSNIAKRQTSTLDKVLRIALYVTLLAMALVYLAPFVVMLLTSLKDVEEIRSGTLLSLPASLDFYAWGKAWSGACTGGTCEGIAPYFLNSFQIVIPAVLISTIVGALNGYVISHWKFRGSNLFFAALLLGCFIPFQVILLPMARTLGWLGIANTTTGLVFVHVVYGVAFTTLFFRNFYQAVPAELVKAARLDGAGFFTIFYRIILPISTPIIVVTIIWQFTQIWNDFLFGVAFSGFDTQPVTVALNNLVNTSFGGKEYNVDMAAAIIAALPTLLVYVLAGKYFVRGLTAGAVKG
ncbi:carbohydrate ABC transporter permease [Marinomonas mediterranea]|jgi:carbohydrate ABC transporter membrane protein 2, CUT1 family (TC 3.A.1.1.-)|uniref:ABC-type transporter, integral membrane subunit n=1 Tax=Marinomonas mediterranea (strain ATCC 700492 / JCM 21426 / NBRC 103028 / MMB-1) TaxID=717774 RepID=F2K041_MARM1|nr:carbohydrate ABC transporter permease [Marinomonas mediterranea]ADZ93255.1 ABC-type transporter, integral membrane subunit [Marinomonas mediterranea MMB-1]WCN11143.1 ABC transporter permease subunit [Marinomonas mediterranea]WCN15206.1 ABC transporter permease subunit [Marinomonas mediterranea]WCN19250.1 ABC transporter permease subunit [Marinomonas mediterranea MMB-1]